MGPGAVPPAGRQRRRQGHVGPGHGQEHAVPAGGATDGQRVCTTEAGRKLRGENQSGTMTRTGNYDDDDVGRTAGNQVVVQKY